MRHKVTLIERPGGWLWAEHDRAYASLVRAVRAVNADARLLAKSGAVVVTMIEYRPCTDIGRMVAEMFSKGELS